MGSEQLRHATADSVGLAHPEEQLGSGVAATLGVEPRLGLEAAEVLRRRGIHGSNALREVEPTLAWRVLLRQFASWIVALLGAASVVAFAAGEWLDGIAIAAVLVLNSGIGFLTELRAVRSMEALRQLGSVRARVRREGREIQLDATDLVPGDVVLLEAGDVVTADLRLLEASKLEVDESALTGESFAVAKDPAAVPQRTALAERSSMLFKGTALTRGTAEAVVTATGMETELGRIAALVQSARTESTPLEKQLGALGKKLIVATLVIAAITIAAGILSGHPPLLMVETGVALAVAAIPEGLPIVATLALARGMWRMARRNVLVNRLSAVETLGATTLIFTDKTGTLTENRMVVRRIASETGDCEVTGEDFVCGGDAIDPRVHPPLQTCLEVAVLCNNATLGEEGPALGDPMEIALLEVGRKAGLSQAALLSQTPEIHEVAFDPACLMMATVHRLEAGVRVAVKGAAEAVLAACTTALDAAGQVRNFGPEQREEWAARVQQLAAGGLRILGVAQRFGPDASVPVYEQLTWLGLLALADPPRSDVREAIAACHDAGLRVVMVTGDHAATAASIAKDVGLTDDPHEKVLLGVELEGLDKAGPKLEESLLDALIYSRVTPAQKLQLIEAHQARGEIVAMTGDGVNDAPALRKANIGVAMGLGGTQVAREAADMVLTDDSFASIIAAVEQGRVIFDNIRKFVFYLLSCNVSEVLVISLAAVIGVPLPLLPLQILFLNFVTDVFPALALAFGEGHAGVLRRSPRDPHEALLTRRHWFEILGFAALISACVLAALYVAMHGLGYDRERAVTVSFLTLALAQLLHVFNARSPGRGIFVNEVTRNPWVWGALVLCSGLLLAAVKLPGLSHVLGTQAPDATGWALAVSASLVPLVLGSLWRSKGQSP